MSLEEPIVYIVDDDQAMLDSLSWVIESFGLQVKTYTSGDHFIKDYDPNQHGCLLLDVRMKGISGPELQQQLQELQIQSLPIIFISGYGDIQLVVRIMRAGALDFLTKPFNNQMLLETINKALRIDKANRERISLSIQRKAMFSSLSSREMQVLNGICEGKRNKSISNELNISLKTVEAHRASVIKKIKVKSVSELIRVFITNYLQEEGVPFSGTSN